MKIPSDLQRFEKGNTLVIVAGKQDAVIYKASGDSIVCLDDFKIPKPQYSDRVGEFKKRGYGKVISSGGVKEIKDSDIIRDFIKELKKRIKKISNLKNIYILAPAKTKNRIKSALSTDWQKKIRKIIEGNFYYRHPLEIIRKLPQ